MWKPPGGLYNSHPQEGGLPQPKKGQMDVLEVLFKPIAAHEHGFMDALSTSGLGKGLGGRDIIVIVITVVLILMVILTIIINTIITAASNCEYCNKHFIIIAIMIKALSQTCVYIYTYLCMSLKKHVEVYLELYHTIALLGIWDHNNCNSSGSHSIGSGSFPIKGMLDLQSSPNDSS